MSEDKQGPDEAKDEAPEKAADASSPLGLLKSATTAALPVVVSAVVSVGFVAFAGKAILWTRFEALQVPGDQVVKAVPQSEAVATGASLLLIFGALGVLAAISVYLIDRPGRATALMSRSILAIVGVEIAVAIWSTHGDPLTSRIAATEVVALAIATAVWVTFVAGLTHVRKIPGGPTGEEAEPEPPRGPFYQVEEDGTPPVETKSGGQAKVTSGITCVGSIVTLYAATVLTAAVLLVALAIGGIGWGAVAALAALGLTLGGAVLQHCIVFSRNERRRKKEERTERERQAELAKRPMARMRTCLHAAIEKAVAPKRPKPVGSPPRVKESGIALSMPGAFLMGALAVVAVAVPSLILWEWWLLVALAAAALLGAGLWRIASLSKDGFVWYGLAVFISVPLFGTVMLMASNAEEPKVQPMALIRTTDGPDESIQGLYVTEADDRVYFASVATEGCKDEVRPNSGRLLWVPKEEVVAMAVGPLESVEEASRSALEMSYDLTPAVETGGATVELADEEAEIAGESDEGSSSERGTPESSAAGVEGEEVGRGAGAKEGEKTEEGEEGEEAGGGSKKEHSAEFDTRLENTGPAVRPNFGTGLRVEPETVSPGGEATLTMSKENAKAEGFGDSRAGRNVRLGSWVVNIAKEPAGGAHGAEYIELDNRRLIALGKEGAYVKTGKEDFELEDDAGSDQGSEGPADFVRLDDPTIQSFQGLHDDEGHDYVKVSAATGEADAKVIGVGRVTLAGGTFEGHKWGGESNLVLKGSRLMRQAWHGDRIRFHIPEDARSGVVAVECAQLAGAPLLRVSHAPTARMSVEVLRKKDRIRFDGSRSSDEDGAEEISRRWKINGVGAGHGKAIANRISPRPTIYSVELTVTDKVGNSDTARIQLLRLPTPKLGDGLDQGHVKNAIDEDREAIEKGAQVERPAKIELDAYTDHPRSESRNLNLALKEASRVRAGLLSQHEGMHRSQKPVSVEELAFGEACPLDRVSGRHLRNRHVDVFVLGEGVIVKHPKACRSGDQKSFDWHPPLAAEPVAGISSTTGGTAAVGP